MEATDFGVMKNIFSGRSRPLTGWNRGQIAFSSSQFADPGHSVYNFFSVSSNIHQNNNGKISDLNITSTIL